jgi:cellulose synthase/poly-beta-1,6-N-acetylglucosamine synthase-like glycosyltransferase
MLPAPLIPDTKRSDSRPFWSVMIPAYNLRADYLEETLNNAVQQDPGRQQIPSEVIDESSMNNTASDRSIKW